MLTVIAIAAGLVFARAGIRGTMSIQPTFSGTSANIRKNCVRSGGAIRIQ